MKKNNYLTLKFIAIFIITLIISLTVETALSLSPKQSSSIPLASAAEQEGCCIEDSARKMCLDDSTPSRCLPGKFVTYTGGLKSCSAAAASDCGPQTCVPQDASKSCLRAKTKIECIKQMNGTPIAADMDSIDQCRKGCCIINNGAVADIMQNRTCVNKTLGLVGNYDLSGMQFLPDVQSETECKKLGASTDVVCCVLGGGNCKYGFRSECTTLNGRAIPLQGGEYCRDVRECAVSSQAKQDCGKRLGTEFDIYWFDSQGNQEELVQACDYPSAFCQIDQMSRTPKCIQTTCQFNDSIRQQKISDINPPEVEKIVLKTNLLLTGTSECYNFYTDYKDSAMYGKSTGLQNQILHCSLGKVEIQGLGPDRNLLCRDGYGPNSANASETLHGVEINNSWQACSSCGKGGLIDPVGDFFAPFAPFGWVLDYFLGKFCTKDECEKNLGKEEYCSYKEKLSGNNIVTLGTNAPISTCVPKYPPGTNSFSGLNNTNCGLCGNIAQNGLWNLCQESECVSLGDCDFTPMKNKGLWWFLIAFGTFIAGRVVWMPVDCLTYATIYSAPKGGTTWAQDWQTCWNVRKDHFTIKIVTLPLTIIGLVSNPKSKVENAIATVTGLTSLLVLLGLMKK